MRVCRFGKILSCCVIGIGGILGEFARYSKRDTFMSGGFAAD